MKNGLLALFILLLAPVILYAHGEMKHEELGRNILKAEKKGIKVKGWIDNIEKTIQEAAKDLDLQVVADKEDPLPNHRVTFWIGKSASSGALKKVRMRILSGDGPWEKTLISIKGHYSTDIPLKETGEYQAILAIETEKNGNVEFRVNLKNE